jgi:hypothetical protein
MIKVNDLTYKQYLQWEQIMEEVGVKYINSILSGHNYDCFEVIDEQKLLIGTIKHGLQYETIYEQEQLL